ncbi:MAG: metal-dependent phosphohydrolase [Planctomycetota bacterium]|nr:MAG: metal-dependent phosphohydrolase [Planctomycetota bacterium]
MLRGAEPEDYDVATSAPPPAVQKLFPRSEQVGAKFGVIIVHVGGRPIEVATFRRDLDYADGRRPVAVEFTDAREDAIRRDFTVNGMFFDPIRSEVVDYVGGQTDLRAGIIRAIGDPERRFSEDHLRLLRGVRLAAKLDFTIEPVTWAAMKEHAPEIARISPERIREELDRMLSHSGRARAFGELRESGLLGYLWPTAKEILASADRSHAMLEALPANARFEAALAAILHGTHRAYVEEACDSLRCSNDTKRDVAWLVAHECDLDDPARVRLADLKLLMANAAFPDLLALFGAKLRALGYPPTAFEEVSRRAEAVLPQDVAPPPLVTGNDLAAMGVGQGPIYKKILDRVYYAQLNGDIADAPAALQMARRLADELGQQA